MPLDPRVVATAGHFTPKTPLPPNVQTFGRFPDTKHWRVGDLLLFSAIEPSRVQQLIIDGQARGGYHDNYAQWHHAAVYLGENTICEAHPWRGVQNIPLYGYIGDYMILVLRDHSLTEKQSYAIAIRAMTRLKSPYSLGNFWELSKKAFRNGFWTPDAGPKVATKGACICSELYCWAYAAVTDKLLAGPNFLVAPAALAMAPALAEVHTTWLKIAGPTPPAHLGAGNLAGTF